MNEVLQLQRKAEHQRIIKAEPEFVLPIDLIDELALWKPRREDVERALGKRRLGLDDLAALLSPAAVELSEIVVGRARDLSQRRFGRTMHMFAPLYISNECVSECTYCGFQVYNKDIVRRTLEQTDVLAEAGHLVRAGMRHLLLVAGEHPKHVSSEYIASCISTVACMVPSVSVEVQAFDVADYQTFVEAGCDGVVLYQEVYDPRLYPTFHLKGNKRFWGWRLGAVERAASAGMRRLGLGTLVGLNQNWRWEVLALAAHAQFVTRRFWRCEVTVALPRLEPAAGLKAPSEVMSDEELRIAIAALRLTLPDVGIVLSTREPPPLRDRLVAGGVTFMSAGSSTEPGGYCNPGQAQEQFQISDERPISVVAEALRSRGYDPVWKDWG